MNFHRNGYQLMGMALTAIIAGFLTAGCQSDKTEIKFSDDASMPRLDTNSVALPKSSALPKEDEAKIEIQVFSNLLTKHFWEDGDYTAIFLRADDAEVTALQKQFSNRKPPIKESYRVDLKPNQSPRDKDTGKPAMILSVDMDEPAADGTVTAIGKWYAGGAVTGFYSYQLKKTGDDWVIQNAQ
ncbi:MAG TPA: hypothetical protein VG347_08615 [Verrucomicrobiae bacterium]|nr:hypothetical protein [Verrucomicrobiae bacterium]